MKSWDKEIPLEVPAAVSGDQLRSVALALLLSGF